MKIERQIEFDKVKDRWAELAVTDWAKETIREATLYFSESELKKKLKDTSDARMLIEKLGMPPLQNMTEIKEGLLIAEKGDCLTPYQLGRSFRILWRTMTKIWMSYQNCVGKSLLKSEMER